MRFTWPNHPKFDTGLSFIEVGSHGTSFKKPSIHLPTSIFPAGSLNFSEELFDF